MEFERRHHDHTHMDIDALVDVVFLLLLFFMLTSHLMQEPTIKIKLPESKTAEYQVGVLVTVVDEVRLYGVRNYSIVASMK